MQQQLLGRKVLNGVEVMPKVCWRLQTFPRSHAPRAARVGASSRGEINKRASLRDTGNHCCAEGGVRQVTSEGRKGVDRLIHSFILPSIHSSNYIKPL